MHREFPENEKGAHIKLRENDKNLANCFGSTMLIIPLINQLSICAIRMLIIFSKKLAQFSLIVLKTFYERARYGEGICIIIYYYKKILEYNYKHFGS